MHTDNPLICFDDRRDLIIPGDNAATVLFATEHFIKCVLEAQNANRMACVALSGGSTPKAIFQNLASPQFRDRIDWTKVYLFWSDERCVAQTDPESNYKMAMDAGFATLNIPETHIFRMPADAANLEKAATEYENTILKHVPNASFDLIMLGMGDDGHTASLFPGTVGLNIQGKLVIANYVPQKSVWRLSFTFTCINQARHIAIYVLGKSKKEMVDKVLNGIQQPNLLPIQLVGTASHKALWIIDHEANIMRK